MTPEELEPVARLLAQTQEFNDKPKIAKATRLCLYQIFKLLS